MKIYFVLLAFFTFSTSSYAQSVSSSKILNYLSLQDETQIGNDLIKQGFSFDKKSNFYGFTEFAYSKSGSYGQEKLNFGYNDELYMIVYQLPDAFYLALKEKMLTSEFVYSYDFKNNKYYESETMRIGINDASHIISFYVNLK